MKIKRMSDIPIGSKVDIIVEIGNKEGVLEGKVIEKIPNKKQNGIGIEAIYHNNKKINFKNYKVFIQYTTPKDVVYRFLVSLIDINYNENIIRFYTKQTAKPFGYRQTHRYICGYDADIKIEGTKLNLNGYCKDASYTGIAFICKDEDKKLRHGQKVNATVTFKDLKFKNLKGKIVRIEENYFGETSLVGINFDKVNKDVEYFVNTLKEKEEEKQKRLKGI